MIHEANAILGKRLGPLETSFDPFPLFEVSSLNFYTLQLAKLF